jgi:hypothetical protein
MLVYQIQSPRVQPLEEFTAFMRDEYFPCFHKGPTRAFAHGQLVADTDHWLLANELAIVLDIDNGGAGRFGDRLFVCC